MAFKRRTSKDHPLQWGDRELQWLISVNRRPNGTVRNMAAIYRAMGYKGTVITESFKRRVEKLAQSPHEEGHQ